MPKTGAAVAASQAAGKKASSGTFEKQKAAAQPNFTVHGRPMTVEEFAATHAYQGAYYADINIHLRGLEGYVNKKALEHIGHLDKIIGRTTFKSDTTLYRGMTAFEGFDPAKLRAGDVYTDKAFFSTSLKKSAAAGFTDELSGKGILFTIHAPAGTKHLPIHAVGTGSTFQQSEKEILLPRGTSVRIKSITKSKSGVYHAHAEILQ